MDNKRKEDENLYGERVGDNSRRPFYKTIWFWVLFVLAIAGIVGGSMYANKINSDIVNNKPATKQGQQVTDQEQQQTAQQSVQQGAQQTPQQIVRSSTVVINGNESDVSGVNNSDAKPVTLNSGTYYVGKQINQGIYITEADSSGKVELYNSKGNKVFEETIKEDGNSVPNKSVIILKDGDKLVISGMNKLSFTPYKRQYRDVLNQGIWQVGENVKPGNYMIEIPSGVGVISVSDAMGMPIFNELVNNSVSQSVKISLVKGDNINIMGLSGVKLVPLDNTTVQNNNSK
ncbi:hypothetical protein [Clostridium mediterraneense]|uniref:hypothetical protein n=1 Tax=Clostridium mediterraneense TaxID=1805472 RepID=UPI0008370F1A|nr:hypothetical protein [Clostridium mediterraneense]